MDTGPGVSEVIFLKDGREVERPCEIVVVEDIELCAEEHPELVLQLTLTTGEVWYTYFDRERSCVVSSKELPGTEAK